MLNEGTESDLLEKAEAEEKAYNWAKAAELYEQITKSYLDKNFLEKAAIFYDKIGYKYFIASDQADTAVGYKEFITKSSNAYKKATDLFRKAGNKVEELECEAFERVINLLITDSPREGKNITAKSLELLIQSHDLCSKEHDREALARILSRAEIVSALLTLLSDDPKEIDNLCQKGIDIMFKAWNASINIKNVRYLADTIFYGWIHLGVMEFIRDFHRDKYWKKKLKALILMFEENLDFIESCNDYRALGMIYSAVGGLYFAYYFHFSEDEIEQNKYFNKAINLAENGLNFARKARQKNVIIYSMFMLSLYGFLGGKFDYVQKRIVSDINEALELGKTYEGSNMPWLFFANYLATFYYCNIAQMKFFTSSQRVIYAKKGIEYAQKTLKCFMSAPTFVWIYQLLTMCYSQLCYLETAKVKRDEYVKKLIECMNQAKILSEKFEAGFARATSYASIIKTHKTLADIADTKEKKVKMLSIAAEASNKYLRHAIETRTGIIAAKMRLGLLYEEISSLSEQIDTLIEAKDLFLEVVNDCLERGYNSYLAATYEYLARIDDRMGEYDSSAKYYEKAQNTYEESLKNIEYKPLRKRAKEKIEYIHAWIYIEKAKSLHNKEDYIDAKKKYEMGSQILNGLPDFDYEAIYYSAWASQENAELFSKQEKHDEAIDQYEKAKSIFANSLKTIEKISKKSKDKVKVERVKDLEKIAKIRIKYCSARTSIERARILERQGELLASAELFASAASQFRYICNLFTREKEQNELKAVYYLCRAWESMELAEKYEDPEKFAEAAILFEKASKIFIQNSLKFLASGNAAFCQALESGCEFDDTIETNIKAELYPKIKIMLRKAAELYRKGGFVGGADWALATSTYFDAAWALIRADEELDFEQKNELLRVGSEYLRSAADLFAKSGNIHKNQEVLERLDMVEKEKKIIFSALNSIKKPYMTSSTVGIVAPACPLESSQSPRLGEVYQFNEEERRVILEKALRGKYEIIYRDLLKEYPRVQKRECRVGVAQIGISQSGNIVNEFYEMKVSGLLGLREDKIDMIRTKVKTMIENAAENRVNILIFPEMTIDLNYSEIIKDISDLAKLYNMYIIPGSYHDQETKRNVSLVIGPDGILWEQEKHIPAIIHLGKKMFKEAIEVGTFPRKTIVCNTEYGRIAIAICRDFLDMDLRVELKNFEPPVDIILNPAFTPVTADFKAAHFDARRSIYAYCFFANVGEFGDSLIYTPEKERIERTIPAKKEGLIYKDVDLFKLRSERKKWEKEQRKERLFIQSTR